MERALIKSMYSGQDKKMNLLIKRSKKESAAFPIGSNSNLLDESKKLDLYLYVNGVGIKYRSKIGGWMDWETYKKRVDKGEIKKHPFGFNRSYKLVLALKDIEEISPEHKLPCIKYIKESGEEKEAPRGTKIDPIIVLSDKELRENNERNSENFKANKEENSIYERYYDMIEKGLDCKDKIINDSILNQDNKKTLLAMINHK